MKHLTTLLTMAITLTGLAQQMPYNPDANGDDFVGVDDVLGVLGVYDTALMQPDLQCDYEGTGLEEFIGGIFNQELELDSVYVEYLYVDSVETYIAGCPDPIFIETVLQRSMMMPLAGAIFNQASQVITCASEYLGYHRDVEFRFNSENGRYTLKYTDLEVEYLTPYHWYHQWQGDHVSIPFSEDWSLTENGIQVNWGSGFVHDCQQFRLIPFWHEAE